MAADMVDPMDAIAPSEANDVGQMSEVDEVAQRPRQRAMAIGQQELQTNLCPQGIRTILGRKQRSRPLLRLVCRGCLKSTHDEDPLVPGDSLEILGLD